ncbi:MAG: hypothetical protein AB7K52_04355 [Phycisphaerales bacterium]
MKSLAQKVVGPVAVGFAALGAGFSLAHAAPPFSVSSLATSGDPIADVGIVNSAFYNNNQVTPCTGGRGVLKVAVNDSGQWLIQTDSPSIATFQDTALISSLFPPTFFGHTPYLIEGTDGYLTAPTFSFIAAPFGMTANVCSPPNPFWTDNAVGGIAVGNSGVNAMMLRVLPGLNADPVADAGSAIYHNLGAVVAREGQLVNCPGLDPGTVWGPLTSETATMNVNSSNQYGIVAPVVEMGVSKRAVIVVSVDGAGSVLGSQLVAVEGGPVGAGPQTWVTIAAAPYTAAINDSGTMIFSGQTSTGVTGLFMNGGFVAFEGGPTPDVTKTWGSLLGVPVDLNNRGDFVFRALTGDGIGIWNELAPDAGEQYDGQNGLANVPADSTVGNGALNTIVGSLSSDTDVDMYRIRITDPMAFSATTVPDGGIGFPGAAFDTVLYLIREPGNGTACVERSDDVSPSVVQSTLTGQFVPAVGDYYLAVATPKTRPLINRFYFGAQIRRDEPAWIEDPGFIGVANSRVLWSDPSNGIIGRALTTTGAMELAAPVGTPQVPTPGAGQSNITGPICVTGGAGKVYWISSESGATRLKNANFDGSGVTNLIQSNALANVTSVTGLAADAGANRLFWCRAALGEIWRSNLGGGSAELMIKSPEEITVGIEGTFVPRRIAAGGGFVFWTNPVHGGGSIQRASQTTIATSGEEAVTTIISGVQAEQIAVDAAGGKIYWTETTANLIRRANFDGTGVETFVSTPRPLSIALDATTVYWSNGDDRVIRRAPIASPGSASTLVSLGADTGVTIQEVLAQGNGFNGWERVGASVPGALPYQVRLTGASPRIPDAMIAKNNNVKVVGTYDEVPGRPGSRITVIGSTADAFKMSDRGDVLWRGSYFEPTVFINYQTSALFLNNEAILIAGQIPPTFSDRLVFFYSGPGNVDLSRNGEWAVVSANTQVPPFNFTFQPDRALLLHFDLPPECAADFNGDGNLDPDDLGDYINCYFGVPPCDQADFNNDGNIDPDDLGDFINAYFSGC